ncbi:hypothetical protein [Haliangium sp. UPWRP_2]|uniref:hypothetical protein n=1 Tax=Haliangium sp. UPWRP_2 TaxID=1931276 RepID=UPI000B54183A|nr:hypothetical protein [Haliangium sp. UPWRP_2]PSM31011.1 hypothetical protein BVG81_007575 [Haliangium sp. UPWRP_2]
MPTHELSNARSRIAELEKALAEQVSLSRQLSELLAREQREREQQRIKLELLRTSLRQVLGYLKDKPITDALQPTWRALWAFVDTP